MQVGTTSSSAVDPLPELGQIAKVDIVINRGRAIGLDYLIRLQEELHVYIGEQGEPKGPGQPGGGA